MLIHNEIIKQRNTLVEVEQGWDRQTHRQTDIQTDNKRRRKKER